MLKFILVQFLLLIPLTAFSNNIEIPEELKNKTISIVVGYGPGGTPDIFSRILSKKLKEKYNLDVVVINKPGAGGAIGSKFTADSLPDGTTMNFVSESYIVASVKNMPSWPKKHELIPVSNIFGNYLMLIGANKLEKYTLSELMDLIRKNPEKFNYASTYIIDAYYTEVVLDHYKSKAEPIPFKSTPDALNALAADTIQLWMTGLALSVKTVAAKQAVPFLITSPVRSKAFPNIPTLSEIIPSMSYQTIYTMYLPEKTPINILKFYNTILTETLKDPEIAAFMTTGYLEPLGHDLETTQRIIDNKWETWRSQIK